MTRHIPTEHYTDTIRIKQDEPHLKSRSGAQNGRAVPTPLVTPVMLLDNWVVLILMTILN